MRTKLRKLFLAFATLCKLLTRRGESPLLLLMAHPVFPGKLPRTQLKQAGAGKGRRGKERGGCPTLQPDLLHCVHRTVHGSKHLTHSHKIFCQSEGEPSHVRIQIQLLSEGFSQEETWSRISKPLVGFMLSTVQAEPRLTLRPVESLPHRLFIWPLWQPTAHVSDA